MFCFCFGPSPSPPEPLPPRPSHRSAPPHLRPPLRHPRSPSRCRPPCPCRRPGRRRRAACTIPAPGSCSLPGRRSGRLPGTVCSGVDPGILVPGVHAPGLVVPLPKLLVSPPHVRLPEAEVRLEAFQSHHDFSDLADVCAADFLCGRQVGGCRRRLPRLHEAAMAAGEAQSRRHGRRSRRAPLVRSKMAMDNAESALRCFGKTAMGKLSLQDDADEHGEMT